MTKYYVRMTDKFLSGWGQAEGKINKLVIECDTYEEAQIVAQNAKQRSEMKHISIGTAARYKDSRYYKVNLHDKSDYKSWFIPKFFAKEKLEDLNHQCGGNRR